MHCLRVRSSTIRDFVEKEYLPKSRAGSRMREFNYDRICLSRTDIAARRQRAGNAGPGQDLAPGKQTSFAAELTGPRKPRRLATPAKRRYLTVPSRLLGWFTFGAQYEFIRREAFEGIGGAPRPTTMTRPLMM